MKPVEAKQVADILSRVAPCWWADLLNAVNGDVGEESSDEFWEEFETNQSLQDAFEQLIRLLDVDVQEAIRVWVRKTLESN